MKKLKDILNESNYKPELGKVYSNPYATSFVKENEEEREPQLELSEEQKKAFFEAVKQYKKFGESVYRNAGLSEVYESIKNMVEVANKVTISETGDWFDGVTVGRHMKRMGESFKVFEKTLKEVGTLQQRLESSYDEIGEVLGKYYEISELNETEDDIEEGNEFGAARAKAIANGDSEFEVDGKSYPVKDVDKDDKENAKEFSNEGNSMKLTNILKENKYSIIDPRGNTAGTGTKDQANKRVKQLGGSKKGYFVVPAKSALKARRAMEKYKFDFKNAKLQDTLSDFYWESVEESVNESEFAGWIAGYNGKQIEIKKGEAKDLYNAKLLAIKKLKVPKSKVGLMFIKPAVDESVMNEAHFKIGDDISVTRNDGKVFKGKVEKTNPLKIRTSPTDTIVIGDRMIKNIVKESVVTEAKYDIGMARKGNGLTIYNKAEEENGDYKNVAHIDNKGKIKYLDNKIPSNIKKQIEAEAKKMMEVKVEGTMKLKNLLKESIGMGELPSSKLMKMKVSAKDMLESVGEYDVNKSEEELSEGASSEEKRIVMLAVRKIAKYRNVPIDQSVVDVQRAAEELERDIKKGKVQK